MLQCSRLLGQLNGCILDISYQLDRNYSDCKVGSGLNKDDQTLVESKFFLGELCNFFLQVESCMNIDVKLGPKNRFILAEAAYRFNILSLVAYMIIILVNLNWLR